MTFTRSMTNDKKRMVYLFDDFTPIINYHRYIDDDDDDNDG